MKIRVEKFLDGARYLYISKNKHVIGTVNVINAHITDLEIEEKYRRKGFATKLMKRVIEDFGHGDLTLIAEVDEFTDFSPIRTKHLRKFYRKFGFVSDKAHHDYMTRRA